MVTNSADFTALKKECDDNKAALTKFKESVQNVVKKIKEEFTTNKTETITGFEGINKEIKAMQEKLGDIRTAEPSVVDAKPSEPASADLTTIKKDAEETKTNLAKSVEDNKAALAEFKESVQGVVKKIKEEFTANKTET